MSRDPSSSAEALIVASLAPGPIDVPPLGAAACEILWARARDHCLSPYLHERWRRAGVLDRLPGDLAARFSRARTLNAERNRHILLQQQELINLLDGSGIPSLVSKGIALSQACYHDPGMRVLYDIDLFVREEHQPGARIVLEAAGYSPFFARPRFSAAHDPWWRPKEYSWDSERVFDPERPVFVELHSEAWDTSWHGFDLPRVLDIWSATRDEVVEGISLRVLSWENVLVQLAVHYACNALESVARLMHLLDIALILRERADHIDWDQVLRSAKGGRLAAFCFLALGLACQVCRCELPSEVERALREATPAAIARWIDTDGPEEAGNMSIYQPDRSVTYFLHWSMAGRFGEKARVALSSLRRAWQQGRGFGRWTGFLGRNAERLRHIMRTRGRRQGRPRR